MRLTVTAPWRELSRRASSPAQRSGPSWPRPESEARSTPTPGDAARPASSCGAPSSRAEILPIASGPPATGVRPIAASNRGGERSRHARPSVRNRRAGEEGGAQPVPHPQDWSMEDGPTSAPLCAEIHVGALHRRGNSPPQPGVPVARRDPLQGGTSSTVPGLRPGSVREPPARRSRFRRADAGVSAPRVVEAGMSRLRNAPGPAAACRPTRARRRTASKRTYDPSSWWALKRRRSPAPGRRAEGLPQAVVAPRGRPAQQERRVSRDRGGAHPPGGASLQRGFRQQAPLPAGQGREPCPQKTRQKHQCLLPGPERSRMARPRQTGEGTVPIKRPGTCLSLAGLRYVSPGRAKKEPGSEKHHI